MHAILLLLAMATATEIRLQRTACYGVCPDDVVVIRTDGTATFSGMKSDRPGDYRGTLPRADALALAREINALGFPSLKREYGWPNIDAPDYTVTVNGKTVVSHMQQVREVAPIITAILATSAKVNWVPESSGIEGRVFVNGAVAPNTSYVAACGKRSYYAISDRLGRYRLPLRAGTCTVSLFNPGARIQPAAITIRIAPGRYTHRDVHARYNVSISTPPTHPATRL